jgi:hypothetical protein
VSPVVVGFLGCCAVLLFDAVGALAARRIGFPYARLLAGSWALYGLTGYLAARESGVTLVGAAAGAAVAATDSTVGWRIARALRVDSEADVEPGVEIGVAIAVTLSGALIGALAALAA